MLIDSILWRRTDTEGHEAARLFRDGEEWRVAGAALFVHDGAPVSLDYEVRCDAAWTTLSARVTGFVGSRLIEVSVTRDDIARLGCIDVDLNFSASTNLLPIRRLALSVGSEAKVDAAWLRFPTFTLERLDQLYRRTADDAYEYESAGGRFRAPMRVNAVGFPLEYAVWVSVAPPAAAAE